MKRFVVSLMLLLAIAGLQAQKRRAVLPRLPDMTVEEALDVYDLDAAEQLLNAEIAALRKKRLPTEEQEARLQWVRRAQIKLNAVERVTFIDSLAVPRSEVLSHIHLSPECGRLARFADYFHEADTLDRTVFLPEMGDQMYYAQADKDGTLSLYMRDLYTDGSASEPVRLQGISDNDEAQNYPFVMTDGTTIYFAAQGAESLGGYDIFMSRYDAEEHRFLAPENVGMPFNSRANDYLYLVDDFLNLGYFVTDRNMPEDSVCIYVFIPNETRRVYAPEEMGRDTLSQRARITRISDTWDDEQAVRAAQYRLREARADKRTEAAEDFAFVVTGSQVYHHVADFRTDVARKHAQSWLYARDELQKVRRLLAKERAEYHKASATKREQMKQEILTLEANEQDLAGQIRRLEREMRQAELGL